MTSRHLVDPELHGLLERWPQVTLDESLIPLVRDATRLPVGEIANPERVVRQDLIVPGRDGAPDVPMIHYRPAGSEDAVLPCLYHVHGGGYVGGAAAGLEPIHRLLVETVGCALVTVDYRLAPETPFPGPLEDCYAGLDWLFGHASKLNIDPSRIGIGGESAGGGLAAALALLVRDRGEHRIAFQHLIYPMIDDRTCITADPHPHAGQFVWNAASNAFGWRAYLGMAPGASDIPAYAAAARAEDLSGLPPTFLATGALDLFVDEDISYAARLIRAGVSTELHVYPGAFHGFDIDQSAAVSRRLRRDSWDFLTRQLHPSPL
ncbi:alpha/beta hydrolase fold domain-containing protein [Sphingomonas oryzagri]|uniref:Alpha/beta hydrolase fold domain-containing protein n=1 Tax=Sphingomonas oryzagri TaxID=3042314 RepID=A0ABT6N2T7_9SPHN|nr:alpha/beta hydrolase fold domain-containing protein [Sphingomonas oryzagri]MDH7639093.1 alpha/beta hydrolase fold domain-containing protein [Sphingomonas oryzagri]